MSWQGYIDNLLASKKVVQAAICGRDGGVWASSPNFTPSDAEIKMIVNGATKDSAELAASGIRVAGTKYMFLRVEEARSAYGKIGNSGVCAVVTKQGLIIGTYNEDIQPGECTVVVEQMADYLINSNY